MPGSDAYRMDLERRALEDYRARSASMMARPSSAPVAPAMQPADSAPAVAARPATTPSPKPEPTPASTGMDSKTREIVERQNREMAMQPAPRVRAPAARGLSADEETRAREALHQQQQMLGNASMKEGSAMAPAMSPQPAAPATAMPPPAASPAPAGSEAPYSKELEERARQILMERSRAEQAAAQPAMTAPAKTTAPRSTPPTKNAPPKTMQAAPSVSPMPAAAPPANESPARMSKRERLREITDLYMQDKMTPAEYHKRRAEIIAEPE